MRKIFILLTLICVCSFGTSMSGTAFAEEEGETVNDTFSGFDGLVPKGWGFGENAVWNGCKGTIGENKLKFVHVGKKLGFPSWRKLETAWTDKIVLVSYDFKMTSTVDRAAYFPRIGNGVNEKDTSKIVTYMSFAGDKITFSETEDGKRKDTELPIKLEVGSSYKFGFEIDLKAHRQNLYIVKNNSEYYELRDCNFYNNDANSIKYIYFLTYLAEGAEALGEYEIDNFQVREKNDETFAKFQEMLCRDYKVNVDTLKDVRKLLNDKDVLLFVNTPYAVTKAKRTLLDTGCDEVVPIIKNGTTLVPLRFIAENIGATVSYDSGKIEVLYKNKEMLLTAGNAEYYLNGEEKMFDTPVVIINGRTMVPLRAISENFGMEILWRDDGLIGICADEKELGKSVDKYYDRIIKTFGLYVRTDGNDENDGSIKNPVKTMQAARELVYGLKSGDGIPEGGLTVYFNEGSQIGGLTTADIGNDETPIKYICR